MNGFPYADTDTSNVNLQQKVPERTSGLPRTDLLSLRVVTALVVAMVAAVVAVEIKIVTCLHTKSIVEVIIYRS